MTHEEYKILALRLATDDDFLEEEEILKEMEAHFSSCSTCHQEDRVSTEFIEENKDLISLAIISSRLKSMGVVSAEESWNRLKKKLKRNN